MKQDDIKELEGLSTHLKQYAQMPAMVAKPVNSFVPVSLRKELSVAEVIAEEYPSQWNYINVANKTLVLLDSARRLWINQIALGQIIHQLNVATYIKQPCFCLKRERNRPNRYNSIFQTDRFLRTFFSDR